LAVECAEGIVLLYNHSLKRFVRLLASVSLSF